MFKTTAINMLGGTTTAAARAMGISYQAVDKWPPVLTSRIADRVLGVVAKRRFPELAQEPRAQGHPAQPPGLAEGVAQPGTREGAP